MTTTKERLTRSQQSRRQFIASTREHQLTILHDDGVYRHLRCRKPNGSAVWGWDVITWPGYLAVTGDLGSFTFCREQDMLLEFFAGRVNPDYWLEQCTAWSEHSHQHGEVSMRMIEGHFTDGEVLPDDIRERVEELDETDRISEAIAVLMECDPDAWDWTITEPDWYALRALHAIAWTRVAYLAAKEATDD